MMDHGEAPQVYALPIGTEQVRTCDKNIDSAGKLSDKAKRQFLENTVQNHTEFCTVKSTEDKFTALCSKPMTLQKYYYLLQSAARQYNETMSSTKKSHRYVYMSEIT